jgi:hypothetical protein
VTVVRRVVWGWILAGGLGCGGAPAKEASRFPPRPEGCDVHLFHETPDLPTANIGPVRVHCGLDVSEADCLRTLKDQVCKLGGDVVWGVAEKPELDGDENFWRGRAAHTGTPTLR